MRRIFLIIAVALILSGLAIYFVVQKREPLGRNLLPHLANGSRPLPPPPPPLPGFDQGPDMTKINEGAKLVPPRPDLPPPPPLADSERALKDAKKKSLSKFIPPRPDLPPAPPLPALPSRLNQ